ncbi:hypothetical protein C8R45DRAFT_1073281 [Mycena sanguinolenta]|nr:hypothetical protein C8R45DRAFT_1073281 [Mycena sanguinolenta]
MHVLTHPIGSLEKWLFATARAGPEGVDDVAHRGRDRHGEPESLSEKSCLEALKSFDGFDSWSVLKEIEVPTSSLRLEMTSTSLLLSKRHEPSGHSRVPNENVWERVDEGQFGGVDDKARVEERTHRHDLRVVERVNDSEMTATQKARNLTIYARRRLYRDGPDALRNAWCAVLAGGIAKGLGSGTRVYEIVVLPFATASGQESEE